MQRREIRKMMKYKKANKIASLVIIVCLIFSSLGRVTLVKAEEAVIHIKNAEDLQTLAKACSLDTWSQKKVVKLENDIDLTGVVFEGIPTFGGTFDGNGHIVSGISMRQNGSNIGFFRYIQKEGKVINLKLSSVMKTAGTKNDLGGFVGRNAGVIKDCSFVGSVEGESYIGGIAGVNEASGKIVGCHVGGIIVGEHYVGGIVGQNLGLILKCSNEARINTNEGDTTLTLADLEGIDMHNINQTENTKMRTDIGGIAGFSTGIIENCENIGNVGYQHVGYNIGGIVGRQSGYIASCTNKGVIYGRKDVGGIVGQMEPYISLEYTKDKVSRLQDELDTLKRLMDKTMDDGASYSNGMTTKIDQTKGYIDQMIHVTDELANKTEQMYNDGIESINDLSSRVSETLTRLEPIMAQAEVLGDEMSEVIDKLKETVDLLEITSDEGKKAIDHFNTALSSLQSNVKDYTHAASQLEQALTDIEKSIGDSKAVEDALKKLSSGTADLAKSLEKISDGVGKVADAMSEMKEWLEKSEDFKHLMEGLKEAADAISEMSRAATKASQAISKIIALADGEDLQEALSELKKASEAFMAASEHLQEALDAYSGGVGQLEAARNSLRAAISDAEQALTNVENAIGALENLTSNEALKEAADDLEAALDELSKATAKGAEASEKISTALAALQKSLSEGNLSESLSKLDQGVKEIAAGLGNMSESANKIQQAISNIANEVRLSYLQESVKDLKAAISQLETAGTGTDEVISRVKKIADQTKETVIAGDDALAKIKEVAEGFANVAVTANRMINDTHALILDLANKPTIAFPNLDSTYMGKVSDLTATMSDISNTLGSLNQYVGAQNDILIQDIRAVSDQFYKVIDTFIDITREDEKTGKSNERLSIKDFSEDISDKDTDENTQGKVFESLNEGRVEGDVNVGGITGSMAIEYDFDPEDDVTRKGDISFKFQYLARAVIRACTNQGEITSKKNSVGGIVGRMDLGTVIACNGSGVIRSKDGDFVGGIAGASYSHIIQSFALCVLSGKDHVGGIAGYGKRLSNNYAMVEIEEAVECKGAIAGEVEDIEQVSDNGFVDRGVAAIDSISYAGKAEPMTYGTFCILPNIPEAYKKLTLTFVADGKVVDVLPFAFGENVDAAKLPEIPKKAGYYGKWPDFDLKHLTFSKTLEAIYVPFTEIVASCEKQDEKSLALVEGTFGEETVLSVTPAEVARPKGAQKDASLWRVIISGPCYDTEKSYVLRLLTPSDKKVNVYGLDAKGNWVKLDAKRNGSYMIIQMTGDINVFCLTAVSYQKEVILLVVGMSALLLFIVRRIKRKKRGKKGHQDKQVSGVAA